ncbi:aryl-alcohol oxidase-like protein [Stereum hirsutum FP-91666 SS1]|uniref:aryl-alcohol oxidase-like protein n=1 Tax=Stereum hirsutum (strain FP-91666) TaxID=721885 RepID=UPI000444A30F|nr:aryl-alcohol oxidase-like protein [Stereum hirsutum FP-91666 SS1]EIM83224.1 aryl-alcohol oxidase-like protein [Stereum hirsutum FP-91666 SS1]
MSPSRTSLLGSLLLLSSAAIDAKLLAEPSSILNKTYDFIVVGGGTAGSVVASRLSETSASVLLIEAGLDNANIFDAEVPWFCLDMTPNQPWDWNYTVTAQSALDNRTFPYPRGKLLGGSSSVNFLVYNYGGSDDFNRYANVTGDDGWSWNGLEAYRDKTEHFVPPQDGHNTTGQYIPSAHSTNGTLYTSLPGYPTGIDNMLVQAANQLPEFPYTEDMNQGNEIGLGWVYASAGYGTRSSAATAYLTSDVYSRNNLDVLVKHQVLKLVSNDSSAGSPAFTSVQFAASPDSTIYTMNATKEVILSAGSIGTPQIMMLSGIGDSAQLEPLNITTIVNSTQVGRNLQDHPLLPNQFSVNSTDTFDEVLRNTTMLNGQIAEWNNTKTGPLVNTLTNSIGWFRVPDNSSVWETYDDPSAGPTSGHYEFVFANGFVGIIQDTPTSGNYLTAITNLVTPTSRGTITLNSSSPWDYPLIDPAFLSEEVDLVLMREAYKAVRVFLSAPVFDGYIIGPYGAANATSDDDIDAYIRNLTTSVWHPVSTAAMGAKDSDSVTTPDLLVRGTTGLRVVDASVMPYVPAAHPEAGIYLIAERASDLIKSAWKLS